MFSGDRDDPVYSPLTLIDIYRHCNVQKKLTIKFFLTINALIVSIVISIHEAGSNINNNNRKLNYKRLIKHYNLLQNWQKLFTVEIYRNINLSCFLLTTQLGRSTAKQL